MPRGGANVISGRRGDRTNRLYDCQWPGCRALATWRSQRGIHMVPMRMCKRHCDQYRELPDVAAFDISERRGPPTYKWAPDWRFVSWEEHDGGVRDGPWNAR